MLYWFLYQQLYLGYAKQYPLLSVLNVFRYGTFRVAFASLTALFLCILIGPWLIRKLREFQIGQHIREEGPKSHHKKAGTPKMGGVLIIVSIVVPTLLTDPGEIDEQIARLEVHYLANPDGDVRFALLSDWTDAPTERLPGDEVTLAAARAAIERLNRRHGDVPGGGHRFLLFHRRRLWNESWDST